MQPSVTSTRSSSACALWPGRRSRFMPEAPAVHVGSGKVRELFALDDDRLLLVASDRNSTFDVVLDRKSTRLNSSHSQISYAVFCLKKKKINDIKSATSLSCTY